MPANPPLVTRELVEEARARVVDLKIRTGRLSPVLASLIARLADALEAAGHGPVLDLCPHCNHFRIEDIEQETRYLCTGLKRKERGYRAHKKPERPTKEGQHDSE